MGTYKVGVLEHGACGPLDRMPIVGPTSGSPMQLKTPCFCNGVVDH